VEPRIILGLCLFGLAALSGIVAYFYFGGTEKNSSMRGMMPSLTGLVDSIGNRVPAEGLNSDDLDKLKAEARFRSKKRKEPITLDQKLFRAGIFAEKEKADFYRLRMLSPIVAVPVLGSLLWTFAGAKFGLMGIVMGMLLGYQLPFTILDRRINWRNEEIMFFLPLVIEQISIGVSSSLDIGPCLQRVVQMADERDTHNVVTELLKYAQNYIKSGVPFEEAMVETGKASGQTELKHAFMYLAQVAKHGGEITRQLQELADSVSAQRQAFIEGRIKKLELVATGPVTLVFMGFLVILMIGFGVQLKNAF